MVRKNYGLDALANLAKEYLIISTLVEKIRSSNQMEGIYSTRKELKEKIEDTINVYNYMVKKLCKYVDSKYQSLVELILQVTLFGIEGFTMTQLVKITNYSEQSIQAMIKKINHEDNIIKMINNINHINTV